LAALTTLSGRTAASMMRRFKTRKLSTLRSMEMYGSPTARPYLKSRSISYAS
jgi:hypothetical protein